MAQVGLTVAEARERNDEAIEILDKALAEPVTSHHGKYWNFTDLRLVPRPLQRPSPPKWVTVISEEFGAQGGTAWREDLHRLPSGRAGEAYLRCLSRRGCARRHPVRPGPDCLAPPGLDRH